MRKYLYTLLAAFLLLPACHGTWLMYDTDQMDHLYFREARQTHVTSFALIPEDEIHVTTTVYLMGVPADRDRTYSVRYIPVTPGDTLSTGSIVYPLVDAVEGTDYSLGELVLPAGATSTTLDITLHRTPKMLDSCLVRVGIRIVDDTEFLACAPDSNRSQAILSPDFYVYVNDGEPACPAWWKDGNNPIGWHWDLGKFYPAKFRRMLALFHETEKTNPTFFEYCSAAYGYNLDDPDPAFDSSGNVTRLMNTFWRKAYMSAWAQYVFLPLYNYYKEYYAEHPDDPDAEPMGSASVNRGNRVGWSDPLDPTWGFLN